MQNPIVTEKRKNWIMERDSKIQELRSYCLDCYEEECEFCKIEGKVQKLLSY